MKPVDEKNAASNPQAITGESKAIRIAENAALAAHFITDPATQQANFSIAMEGLFREIGPVCAEKDALPHSDTFDVQGDLPRVHELRPVAFEISADLRRGKTSLAMDFGAAQKDIAVDSNAITA
jgi:hypothetical protein